MGSDQATNPANTRNVRNKKASTPLRNRKSGWLKMLHFPPLLASHLAKSLVKDGGGRFLFVPYITVELEVNWAGYGLT